MEIVLFPLAAMGHLNPMVELGKLLLRQGLSVTIIISQFPFFNNKPIDAYISRVSTANPSLSFTHLPSISLSTGPDPPTFIDHFRLSLPYLKDYLLASSARAIILDMFFDAAIEIADELGLPCYYFFPSSASNLAAFLYLPTLHNKITASFKDLGDTPIQFPGFPRPIQASDMPIRISDRSAEPYKTLLVQYERLARSSGIIVNSFQSLEEKALQAFSNGACFPSGTLAPVYFVGPITAGGDRYNDNGDEARHEALVWLDSQPNGSVVFLCFGSMGSAFPEAQLREIALGLESSRQRFLWVVRGATPPVSIENSSSPKTEPDLKDLLPDGFLERTKGKGLVVKSWAPQAAVLGHAAVGGFVTHCGWNSALESIVSGVAMIAWPLYAEQRMNKVFLVEEAKLAVEMRGYKNKLVNAVDVEERIRWLMESEGGKALRARAAAVGESGRAALRDNGSSCESMAEIARLVRMAEDRSDLGNQ